MEIGQKLRELREEGHLSQVTSNTRRVFFAAVQAEWRTATQSRALKLLKSLLVRWKFLGIGFH
jgi:hypothetical protein